MIPASFCGAGSSISIRIYNLEIKQKKYFRMCENEGWECWVWTNVNFANLKRFKYSSRSESRPRRLKL